MKGIIYKIEINENNIYVGSTTQKLCGRQNNHNCDLKTQPHRKLYKSCIENNIKYIKCIWVADVTYDSNAELRKIEEDYRKSLNGNLNMVRCYVTEEDRKKYKKEWDKEYNEQIKDKKKEYYENNKIEINEKQKEYREKNKDKIKEYREKNKDKIKEYREQNKDKLNEKIKEYYEKNKIKLNEKINCDKCNCLINKSNLKRHKKTMKCLLNSECLFSDSD